MSGKVTPAPRELRLVHGSSQALEGSAVVISVIQCPDLLD